MFLSPVYTIIHLLKTFIMQMYDDVQVCLQLYGFPSTQSNIHRHSRKHKGFMPISCDSAFWEGLFQHSSESALWPLAFSMVTIHFCGPIHGIILPRLQFWGALFVIGIRSVALFCKRSLFTSQHLHGRLPDPWLASVAACRQFSLALPSWSWLQL